MNLFGDRDEREALVFYFSSSRGAADTMMISRKR